MILECLNIDTGCFFVHLTKSDREFYQGKTNVAGHGYLFSLLFSILSIHSSAHGIWQTNYTPPDPKKNNLNNSHNE
jgi:hypothetical protein